MKSAFDDFIVEKHSKLSTLQNQEHYILWNVTEKAYHRGRLTSVEERKHTHTYTWGRGGGRVREIVTETERNRKRQKKAERQKERMDICERVREREEHRSALSPRGLSASSSYLLF